MKVKVIGNEITVERRIKFVWLIVLTVLLGVLKVTGLLSMPWWLVTLPVWIIPAFVMSVVGFVFAVVLAVLAFVVLIIVIIAICDRDKIVIHRD